MKQVAKDIVAHFEQRLKALEGKAMVVCMSRRICVDLYGSWCDYVPIGRLTTTTRAQSRS